MATFGIKIDIKDSLPQSAFPNLATAVGKVSEDALAQWQAYARGEPLPDGRTIGVHGGTYLRSIQLRTINDFSAEVFSELPYASSIEEGAPARDMKRMLGSSWKVRVNKKGKRYLIIPFRHDTPNIVMGNPMPQILHEWWQGAMREESRITDTYDRVSGAVGHDINARDRVTVAEKLRPVAEDAFRKAIAADLRRALGGG